MVRQYGTRDTRGHTARMVSGRQVFKLGAASKRKRGGGELHSEHTGLPNGIRSSKERQTFGLELIKCLLKIVELDRIFWEDWDLDFESNCLTEGFNLILNPFFYCKISCHVWTRGFLTSAD